MIWNGNVLMQKKHYEKSSKKWHLIFVLQIAQKKQQFCTFDENVDRTDE